MTALAHEAKVTWYWATTVASTSAPTAANITAATKLIHVTNYDTPSSEAEVDVSDIDSLYDTGVVGTTKAGPITLTIKRDDGTDTMWTLFNTPRTAGFLIKSFNGVASVGAKVEVYPGQYGQRRPSGFAKNAVQTFDIAVYVTSAPNLDAVVAA